MSDTVQRPLIVEFSGDISDEDSDRLAAAGIRWRGAYDALREDWRQDWRDDDLTPWTTRQVVEVKAGTADAARQRVAEALGRTDV